MARSTAARTAVSTLARGSEVVGGDVDAVVVDVDVVDDDVDDAELDVGVSTATDVVVVGTVDSGAALSPELHAARSRAPLTTTPTQRPATTPTPPSTELSRDASGPPTPSVFIATLGEVTRRRNRRHGQCSIRRPPGRIERCWRNANIRKGISSPSGPSIPHPTRHLQRYARCQQEPCPSTGCASGVSGTRSLGGAHDVHCRQFHRGRHQFVSRPTVARPVGCESRYMPSSAMSRASSSLGNRCP